MLFQWIIFLIGISGIASEGRSLPVQLEDFVRARRVLTTELATIETNYESINKNYLIDRIRDLKNAYAQLDRQTLEPAWLYEAQFQLRFTNRKLKSILETWLKKNS